MPLDEDLPDWVGGSPGVGKGGIVRLFGKIASAEGTSDGICSRASVER